MEKGDKYLFHGSAFSFHLFYVMHSALLRIPGVSKSISIVSFIPGTQQYTSNTSAHRFLNSWLCVWLNTQQPIRKSALIALRTSAPVEQTLQQDGSSIITRRWETKLPGLSKQNLANLESATSALAVLSATCQCFSFLLTQRRIVLHDSLSFLVMFYYVMFVFWQSPLCLFDLLNVEPGSSTVLEISSNFHTEWNRQ